MLGSEEPCMKEGASRAEDVVHTFLIVQVLV
jgi:hypothetical protein